MGKEDLYILLGLCKDCSPEEIKQAYRSLLKTHHSDSLDAAAHEHFQQVTAAYRTLSNPDRRKEYDEQLTMEAVLPPSEPMPESMSQPRHEPPPSRPSTAAPQSMFQADRAWSFIASTPPPPEEKVQEPLMSEPRREPAVETPRPGRGGMLGWFFSKDPASAEARNAPEPLSEKEQEPEPKQPEPKQTEPKQPEAKQPEPAAEKPPIQAAQETFNRSFRITAIEAAVGTAKELEIGSGDSLKRIRVRIPPHTKSGTTLRIRHDTDTFSVAVTVLPHPYAEVEGNDLIVRVPITISEAVNGATISVPTLNGAQVVRLPIGWNLKHLITIRNGGLPYGDNQRGDLRVVPYLVPPDAVTTAVQAAAINFDAHYLKPVRKDLPETLLESLEEE